MDPIASGHAAALWVGLHLILLLVLSGLVVRLRQKHKIALGDGGIPELARAVRTFGNATEYVPTGMVAIAVLAIVQSPALAIHIVGLLLFASALIGIAVAASAMTHSAPLAAAIALIANMLLWMADAGARYEGVSSQFINYLALPTHLEPFLHGIVSSVDVVYFLLLTLVALALATRRVNASRTRG